MQYRLQKFSFYKCFFVHNKHKLRCLFTIVCIYNVSLACCVYVCVCERLNLFRITDMNFFVLVFFEIVAKNIERGGAVNNGKNNSSPIVLLKPRVRLKRYIILYLLKCVKASYNRVFVLFLFLFYIFVFTLIPCYINFHIHFHSILKLCFCVLHVGRSALRYSLL